MANLDLLKAYKAQRAAPQSLQRTNSSRGAPTAPSEDAEPEVEEEVEDVTVAENVSQVPDPVALQQSRQAVAQKVLPQTPQQEIRDLQQAASEARTKATQEQMKREAEAIKAIPGKIMELPGKAKEVLDELVQSTRYESLSPRARETQIVQLEQSIARMQEQLDRLKQIPSQQDRGRFEE